MPRPTLVLFCGPPGAGKSTLARRLEAEGRGIRLCTDDCQVALGLDGNDEDVHGRLQALLYQHALHLLAAGTSVILEDGLWQREERTEKFRDGRAAGARIEWHVFDVPREELLRRLAGRNAEAGPGGVVVDEAALDVALGVFQPPSPEEMAAVDEVTLHHGGLAPATGMSADEVVAVVEQLTTLGTTYQVNGGWAVDAHLGRQSREHGDLDVFLDERDLTAMVDWLTSRGYRPVEDWLPVRLELAGPRGRVDLHPMAIQPHGDGIQQGLDGQTFRHDAADRTTGRIGGRAVVVASVPRLRQLRQGYPPRPEDLHDLAVLEELKDAGAAERTVGGSP